MLKSELIRPRIEVRGRRVSTKVLPVDYHTLKIASDLIRLFAQHVGQSRGVLDDALRDYEGDSLDYPIIRGLAATLSARCTFANTPPLDPVALRETLFRCGPVVSAPDLFHPLARDQAIAEAAATYALTPAQVEAALFADLAEEQLLTDVGEPPTPADLIARYNLEVARGLLYWAREVRLEVYDTYKDLFHYIKLFKLMYSVAPMVDESGIVNHESASQRVSESASEGVSESASERAGESHPQMEHEYVNGQGSESAGERVSGEANMPSSHTSYSILHTPPSGYHVTLFGPISPFVAATLRYGLQFAKFMPALFLCTRWRMAADVQPPGAASREPLQYVLDDHSELRTHFKGSGAFDSRLEADFAAEFEEKYGGAARAWNLAREDELIVAGDSVMIPDFSFTHRKTGRRALLEIVGFWHPHYLRRKLEKVRQAGRRDLILLVYKSANVSEEAFEEASAGEVLMFTRKPVLKDVLAAVERCAV
ncbi:MAG: DUF790 family protein [Anaerolineae bacterium]|nr:DUF790 family protein [Anaerolineae bacterium]